MAKLLRNLLIVVFVLALIAIATVAFVYEGIPTHNTGQTHFDTIIVLGTPAKPDGTPSPEQRERTLEGVREYQAGVAPNIIFTGGPAHNQFVEAHVMAVLAESQGVPPAAIFEEDHAQNTIQNIFYSQQIMNEHGWNNAEVVSSLRAGHQNILSGNALLTTPAKPSPASSYESTDFPSHAFCPATHRKLFSRHSLRYM
jgi:uncharacterized SAM-binding protein YcdF (DUF218 family)